MRELKIIKDGLVLDVDKKQWTASYPKARDYKGIPNNYVLAERVLMQLEKRIKKRGESYANQYIAQIEDMVARGVARKLSKDEIDNYRGPVYYLPHHEVLKPDSESTPFRVVMDPSIPFMGHVLNDYWYPLKNGLSSLHRLLSTHRCLK